MKRKQWYLLILLLVPALAGLVAAARPAAAAGASPLVSTGWLAKHLDTPGLVILDVRTKANYAFSHLPGAVNSPYMSMEPYHPKSQCLLMPTAEEFTRMMRALGVNNSTHVIIYDEGNTASDATKGAAAVWIMESMGHNNVSYLDGGFTKWTFEGRVLDKKVPTPKPGNFTARRDRTKVASLQDVRDDLKTRQWLLVDVRNALQYFGSTKHPNAARYGHLPGALCWPAAFMTNAGNDRAPATLRNHKELEEMAKGVGIPADKNTKIITYCNSGEQAGMAFFVLHNLLGYKNVKAYDGSILEYAEVKQLPLVKYVWSRPAK